jgi:hypothetical protein
MINFGKEASMVRRVVVLGLAVAACVLAAAVFSYAAEEAKEAPQLASKEVSKEQVIAVATAAVKAEGIKLDEVNIIYDEGGKLWSQRLGMVVAEDKSPNYGILKHGFLKNYRTVYFDFKAPIKDVWVFVDKDTGEVLTVYREE